MDLAVAGFRIPLHVPFRGLHERRGLLVKGPMGWGEYSPLPGYRDGSEPRCLAAARSAAFQSWPAPLRSSVPVHVTVPAVSPQAAAALVRDSGCSAAKVKVAEGSDEARVEAVRDALGPSGRLVIDANGSWEIDEAERALRVLGRYGVELAEQPVEGLEKLATLRKRTEIPLAADESVGTVEDAEMLRRLRAADAVVVKVQPLGGVRAAMKVVAAAGVPAIVSSMLETSVGVAAGVALAAALPELPYPCGLGTASFLEGDVVRDPLTPEGGVLEVRRPDVDHQALSRFASPVSVPDWFIEESMARGTFVPGDPA